MEREDLAKVRAKKRKGKAGNIKYQTLGIFNLFFVKDSWDSDIKAVVPDGLAYLL